VFFKEDVPSACLLCDIQFIENSRSDAVSDFNRICYRAVIEFLTLENVSPQQIHNRINRSTFNLNMLRSKLIDHPSYIVLGLEV